MLVPYGGGGQGLFFERHIAYGTAEGEPGSATKAIPSGGKISCLERSEQETLAQDFHGKPPGQPGQEMSTEPKACPLCPEGRLFIKDKGTPDEVIYCRDCPATWSDGKVPEIYSIEKDR